jgi:hypothetical protein
VVDGGRGGEGRATVEVGCNEVEDATEFEGDDEEVGQPHARGPGATTAPTVPLSSPATRVAVLSLGTHCRPAMWCGGEVSGGLPVGNEAGPGSDVPTGRDRRRWW